MDKDMSLLGNATLTYNAFNFPDGYGNTISSLVPTSINAGCINEAPACQKKEDTMSRYDEDRNIYVENDVQVSAPTSDASQAREYLSGRIWSIREDHRVALMRQFGLMDDPAPSTFNELLARIQAGKYVISDENKDKKDYDGGVRYVSWRDPSVKKDQKGFDAAMVQLQAAEMATRDIIAVKSPDEGLAAIQALMAWKPTPATA